MNTVELTQPTLYVTATVAYVLTDADCAAILKHRRAVNAMLGMELISGNYPQPGDIVPAIVVRPWSNTCFNGQALLDGNQTVWLTWVDLDQDGKRPGSWHWPEYGSVLRGTEEQVGEAIWQIPPPDNAPFYVEAPEGVDLAALGNAVDVSLPPLVGTEPAREILVRIAVAGDFESRLDNQAMVLREILADRWSWRWDDQPISKPAPPMTADDYGRPFGTATGRE